MQSNGITRAAEIAYVVLILAVAGIVWREASALPPAPYDSLGPKSFPIWVSYGLGGARPAPCWCGSCSAARLAAPRRPWWWGSRTLIGEHARRPWVAIATLILAFAYAAALSFRGLGFLPATAVYLFLSGVVLGPIERRRILIVAIFAVAAAILLDLVFRTIFKLDLT